MKILGALLRTGMGTIIGLFLTAGVRKHRSLISNCVSATKPANKGLEERSDQAENRLAIALADVSKRLSSLQELVERSTASFDEERKLVAAELRRLRVLVTGTLILSCFGVVSFAIVLFLAYIKY